MKYFILLGILVFSVLIVIDCLLIIITILWLCNNNTIQYIDLFISLEFTNKELILLIIGELLTIPLIVYIDYILLTIFIP